MKKLFFPLFLFLGCSIAIHAQKLESPVPSTSSAPATAVKTSNTDDQEARTMTETLTAKYHLTADQAKQMYTIQVRKKNNLAQIEGLQASNPALYRAKMQNVQKGTLASIRRILQTKDQVDLYQKTQSEVRVLRNQKQKELVAQKASNEAIETALMAIYAE